MRLIPHSFFDQPTVKVAEYLIGCYLVRKYKNKIERYMITETEAYDGFMDQASHASRGKTKRNEIMFRSAGHIYVYFTYGMHWMLNIVTGPKDYPAAVLIRGIGDVKGPARLTKKLNINGSLNGNRLGKKTGLWIESPKHLIDHKKVRKSERIGIQYAGPVWSKKKWRFLL